MQFELHAEHFATSLVRVELQKAALQTYWQRSCIDQFAVRLLVEAKHPQIVLNLGVGIRVVQDLSYCNEWETFITDLCLHLYYSLIIEETEVSNYFYNINVTIISNEIIKVLEFNGHNALAVHEQVEKCRQFLNDTDNLEFLVTHSLYQRYQPYYLSKVGVVN